MTDTSLLMPLLHSSHAANAWNTGTANSNYLTEMRRPQFIQSSILGFPG